MFKFQRFLAPPWNLRQRRRPPSRRAPRVPTSTTPPPPPCFLSASQNLHQCPPSRRAQRVPTPPSTTPPPPPSMFKFQRFLAPRPKLCRRRRPPSSHASRVPTPPPTTTPPSPPPTTPPSPPPPTIIHAPLPPLLPPLPPPRGPLHQPQNFTRTLKPFFIKNRGRKTLVIGATLLEEESRAAPLLIKQVQMGQTYLLDPEQVRKYCWEHMKKAYRQNGRTLPPFPLPLGLLMRYPSQEGWTWISQNKQLEAQVELCKGDFSELFAGDIAGKAQIASSAAEIDREMRRYVSSVKF